MPQYSIAQLEKIVEVQDLTLKYTGKGVTQKWVYENKIKQDSLLAISKSTFDRWMALPAKRMLKERLQTNNSNN